VFDSKTLVPRISRASTCRGGGGGIFAGHCVICFSDTYVFLAVRIICTRQVANCGPGFNVELTCSVTQIVLVRRDSETRRLVQHRSYFSTSFSPLRITYGWSLRSNFVGISRALSQPLTSLATVA